MGEYILKSRNFYFDSSFLSNISVTLGIFTPKLRGHPYITSAKELGGWGKDHSSSWVGSKKLQFLLTFSTIYVGLGWVSGSEKVKKCADVI